MDDWVNVGELFSDCFDELINNKQKKNKMKPMSSIQQSLGDRFFQITGFRVDNKVFLAASRSFTNKFKKNNGRHNLEVVYSDWFKEYFSVTVDCETVGKSNFFDKCETKTGERVGSGFPERIAGKTTLRICTTIC